MSFNQKPEYTITHKSIPIEDFYRYQDEFGKGDGKGGRDNKTQNFLS